MAKFFVKLELLVQSTHNGLGKIEHKKIIIIINLKKNYFFLYCKVTLKYMIYSISNSFFFFFSLYFIKIYFLNILKFSLSFPLPSVTFIYQFLSPSPALPNLHQNPLPSPPLFTANHSSIATAKPKVTKQ